MRAAQLSAEPVVESPHYLTLLSARKRKQQAKLTALQGAIQQELNIGGGRRITNCTTPGCKRCAAGSHCLMCLAAQLGKLMNNRKLGNAYVAEMAQVMDSEQAMQEAVT